MKEKSNIIAGKLRKEEKKIFEEAWIRSMTSLEIGKRLQICRWKKSREKKILSCKRGVGVQESSYKKVVGDNVNNISRRRTFCTYVFVYVIFIYTCVSVSCRRRHVEDRQSYVITRVKNPRVCVCICLSYNYTIYGARVRVINANVWMCARLSCKC